MKTEALPYLCCPDCRADLSLVDDTLRDGEITRGFLQCTACKSRWPIVEGVPDFVGDNGADEVVQTTSGFARNWNAYNEVIVAHDSLNDEFFRDWVEPLEPSHFDDRVVLDAGCGMGRWLSVSARYRPKALFGVDYSVIAHTAYRNTRSLPFVHVLRADLFRLPLKKAMDVTYCIGVLHHTPDPAGAFDSIASVTKDDGVVHAWVYGKENNEWITNWVSPLREKVTSKLPDPVLHGLSHVLAWQLRIAGRLQEELPGGMSLPYGAYLRYLRRYPFRYMEHIVYDHLVPQLAAYIPYEEVLRWAEKNNLKHRITARNENSWRILASHSDETLTRYCAR
jgi:SAM-dependent methyltransferase/uncharacterized protein YbaR (Trm112 family)